MILCHIFSTVEGLGWYLLKIIFNYLKPYNCMQTNDYYQIEIIDWNHMIISIR